MIDLASWSGHILVFRGKVQVRTVQVLTKRGLKMRSIEECIACYFCHALCNYGYKNAT